MDQPKKPTSTMTENERASLLGLENFIEKKKENIDDSNINLQKMTRSERLKAQAFKNIIDKRNQDKA